MSMVAKEAYHVRTILLSLQTELDKAAKALKKEREVYETKHWYDANKQHLDFVQEELYSLISETGQRILKIENRLLEYWGLSGMKIVPVEHITVTECKGCRVCKEWDCIHYTQRENDRRIGD